MWEVRHCILGQTLVASMGALALVPASTFTQAASTKGSTFFRTSMMASIRGPIYPSPSLRLSVNCQTPAQPSYPSWQAPPPHNNNKRSCCHNYCPHQGDGCFCCCWPGDSGDSGDSDSERGKLTRVIETLQVTVQCTGVTEAEIFKKTSMNR